MLHHTISFLASTPPIVNVAYHSLSVYPSSPILILIFAGLLSSIDISTALLANAEPRERIEKSAKSSTRVAQEQALRSAQFVRKATARAISPPEKKSPRSFNSGVVERGPCAAQNHHCVCRGDFVRPIHRLCNGTESQLYERG